jgi:hypothetical protein
MIGKEKVSDDIMCDYLSKALSKLKILSDNGWQKGKTKIFLRDAQVDPLPPLSQFANYFYQQAKLEEVRVKIYIQKCIVIQKYWKMYSTRKYYKILKASTIKIQACMSTHFILFFYVDYSFYFIFLCGLLILFYFFMWTTHFIIYLLVSFLYLIFASM